MDAPAEVLENGKGPTAKVEVGDHQYFYFRETGCATHWDGGFPNDPLDGRSGRAC